MRMLLGMVLGSIVTVTGAFISDSAAPLTGAPQMVNWEIAGDRLSDLASIAHEKISNLLGG